MSHFCLAVDVDKGTGEGRKGVVHRRVDCSLRRRFQTHPGSQSEARGHDDAVSVGKHQVWKHQVWIYFPSWKVRVRRKQRRKRGNVKFARWSEGGSVLGEKSTTCEALEVRECLEFWGVESSTCLNQHKAESQETRDERKIKASVTVQFCILEDVVRCQISHLKNVLRKVLRT